MNEKFTILESHQRREENEVFRVSAFSQKPIIFDIIGKGNVLHEYDYKCIKQIAKMFVGGNSWRIVDYHSYESYDPCSCCSNYRCHHHIISICYVCTDCKNFICAGYETYLKVMSEIYFMLKIIYGDASCIISKFLNEITIKTMLM